MMKIMTEQRMKKYFVTLLSPILVSIVIFVLTTAAFSKEHPQVDQASHFSKAWKVHEIAQDFTLLDVWEYPIVADHSKGQDFAYFLKMMQRPSRIEIKRFFSVKFLAAGLLINLRMHLGEIIGLDKNINTLPIPGCRETSIGDRLTEKDRKNSLKASELGIQDVDNGPWRIVYIFKDEMLIELSIDVVHVLMHLGWVQKSGNFHAPRLAVYAKPRGQIGRVYMDLIMPFRRMIIYPVMMENAKDMWNTLKR
jgi:hypothetical protein